MPHLRKTLFQQKESIKNQDEVIKKQVITAAPSNKASTNSTIHGGTVATSMIPSSSLAVASTDKLGNATSSKEQNVQPSSYLKKQHQVSARKAYVIAVPKSVSTVTKRKSNPYTCSIDNEKEDMGPHNTSTALQVFQLVCVIIHYNSTV